MSSLNPPEDYRIRTLYVGGIYGIITEQDIRDHFSAYSEVESVKMVSGRSCAFVTYACRRGAEKAATELADNLEIKGLRLRLMWGRLKAPLNEERRGSIQQQTQVIQPPTLAQPFDASTDTRRTAEGSTMVSGLCPEVDNTRASSAGGERVETRTVSSGGGGGKRSSNPLAGMSPQEMRERVMRRKKSSSSSTPPPAVPPVTPLGSAEMAANTQVGSAAVGQSMESSEETPLTRFVRSFPRDFLLHKSGVTTIWPDAESLLFPGPMHLLENKSDIDLLNDATEMTLQAVQSTLMCRRRLLAQHGQQDAWCVRMAEAEAAEAKMSSRLREVETENLSLKEASAAAEARAAAAIDARDTREKLLKTAESQLQEMRLKFEEMREELKDEASSFGLRARAKLMREFRDGKSSSWNPQAEIDFYVAHVGEEADLVS